MTRHNWCRKLMIELWGKPRIGLAQSGTHCPEANSALRHLLLVWGRTSGFGRANHSGLHWWTSFVST